MKKAIIIFTFLTATCLSFISPVLAVVDTACPPGSSTCLSNPLGSIDSPQALIGQIINSILGVVGSLALLFFVYGGLIWMTSSGNQEKVKKGRDTLMWAAIGLAVVFSAYAIASGLITTLSSTAK